jgi:NAD(P)H dehydrogenase (quinone)
MTSAPALAITGSTGRLGGRVARLIGGVPQRLIVRDVTRAPAIAGATTAVASYDDGAAARKALAGIDTLFMVSGAEHPERVAQHRSFIDAAAAAGVSHLVYTSFHGASPTSTFTLARDHHATEAHIRASGLAYTFLRDNLYADFFPLMADDRGVIRGPAGDGRVAAVATDDVAGAAVAVLRDPSAHAAATYDLTGPAALTLHEIAGILSDAGCGPIRYEPETVEEAYASRAVYQAPPWQVDAWVSTYTAIAAGELATVSDAVPRLTGRPATSLLTLAATLCR